MLSDQFIKAGDALSTFDKPVPAPMFRKTFSLDFTPSSASLTVTGLGFYELYINGENVTRGALAPYVCNFDELVVYDEYDLLPYLKKGKNCIGLILGDGFRNNIGGLVWKFDKAACRGPLCTALSFFAEGEGRSLSFEADESFKTHPSAILFNDERMGYIYDSRLEINGWSLPDFDDNCWQNAVFCVSPKGEKRLNEASPVCEFSRIKPVKIEHFDELPFCYRSTLDGAEPYPETVRRDVYVYDFGVNSTGLSEMHIHGNPGQVVTVRHGEWLQQGKFTIGTTAFLPDRDREPEVLSGYLDWAQKDVFILKGGEETLIPHFKFDGFRYLFVEGLLPEQATADAFTFVEIFSDHKERGAFSCSDADLNRLYAMGRRSDLSNFVFFPMDCPHREKNGWTGDASMSAEQMMLQLGCGDSLRFYMNALRNAQRADGALPGIVPTGGWGYEWGNGPTWDSVIFSLPYAVYQMDGDTAIIRENVTLLSRYLDYVAARRDERGLLSIGLGDWVDPDGKNNTAIKAPLIVTDSIMTYYNAKRAEHLFLAVGEAERAAKAEKLAAELREAIRRDLVDFKTMTVDGECQTSQAFGLYAGIFDPEEEKAAFAKLKAIIEKDGETSRCGMIGLRFLFRVLDRFKENELALRMIKSRKFGCYGQWLADPEATTLLENFPLGGGREELSHNHHFLGDILAWMTYAVAGLRPNPTATDTASFEIRPTFLSSLTHAEAYFDAKIGADRQPARIRTAWKRTEDGVILCADVPAGMHGRFFCPDGYASDLDGKELPTGKTEMFVNKM